MRVLKNQYLCRDLLRVGSSTESSPTHSTGAQKPEEPSAATDMDIDCQDWHEPKPDASTSGLQAALAGQIGHEAVRGRLEEGKLSDPISIPHRSPSHLFACRIRWPHGILIARCACREAGCDGGVQQAFLKKPAKEGGAVARPLRPATAVPARPRK